MPAVTVPACNGLTEHYESLRQDATDSSRCSRSVSGRALLRFKGMAAWMRGMGESVRPPACPLTGAELRLPAGIEQNLINLVAAMTLATVREIQP